MSHGAAPGPPLALYITRRSISNYNSLWPTPTSAHLSRYNFLLNLIYWLYLKLVFSRVVRKEGGLWVVGWRGCNGRKVADELHNCSFGTNLRADCDKYKLYKTKYKNPSETKFLKPLSSTTLIKTLIKSTSTQVTVIQFIIITFYNKRKKNS